MDRIGPNNALNVILLADHPNTYYAMLHLYISWYAITRVWSRNVILVSQYDYWESACMHTCIGVNIIVSSCCFLDHFLFSIRYMPTRTINRTAQVSYRRINTIALCHYISSFKLHCCVRHRYIFVYHFLSEEAKIRHNYYERCRRCELQLKRHHKVEVTCGHTFRNIMNPRCHTLIPQITQTLYFMQ